MRAPAVSLAGNGGVNCVNAGIGQGSLGTKLQQPAGIELLIGAVSEVRLMYVFNGHFDWAPDTTRILYYLMRLSCAA